MTDDKGHRRLKRREVWVAAALTGYRVFPGPRQVGRVRKPVVYLATGEIREQPRFRGDPAARPLGDREPARPRRG